jgi:hypothetical protein
MREVRRACITAGTRKQLRVVFREMEGIEGTHGVGADALSKGLDNLGLSITTAQALSHSTLGCATLGLCPKGFAVACRQAAKLVKEYGAAEALNYSGFVKMLVAGGAD